MITIYRDFNILASTLVAYNASCKYIGINYTFSRSLKHASGFYKCETHIIFQVTEMIHVIFFIIIL